MKRYGKIEPENCEAPDSIVVKLGQGPVLAIDSDPDANLGTLLGIKPVQTLGDLRNEVLDEMKNFPAGMSKASYFEVSRTK